jgi:hypothetical protein
VNMTTMAMLMLFGIALSISLIMGIRAPISNLFAVLVVVHGLVFNLSEEDKYEK